MKIGVFVLKQRKFCRCQKEEIYYIKFRLKENVLRRHERHVRNILVKKNYPSTLKRNRRVFIKTTEILKLENDARKKEYIT